MSNMRGGQELGIGTFTPRVGTIGSTRVTSTKGLNEFFVVSRIFRGYLPGFAEAGISAAGMALTSLPLVPS